MKELTCNTSTYLNQATVATYRFRICRTNSNATQLSCYFVFEVTDKSEKILLQVFPNCSASDELSVNNGNHSCCLDCNQPPSVHVNSVTIFYMSNYTEPGELGFDIKIVTGTDESHCSSSVTRITVGTSPVIITSPNFPEKYPSSTQCSYIITSDDPNKGLSLTFEVINLENRCYDLITLVLYNSEPIQICNLTSTDLVVLNENYISQGQVYLRFNSDVSVQAHGFRLIVSQGKIIPNTLTTSPPTSTVIIAVNTTTASTTPSTAITISSTTSYTTLSTLTITNMKTTVETASTTHDQSTEKTTAPSRTSKDENSSGISTTVIAMAVVIGIVSVCLISVLIYFKCYRNQSTEEPTYEKRFHNPAYDDYEMPVKTQADEGDGYEELPVDLCADNKKTVHPDTYNIYLAITE